MKTKIGNLVEECKSGIILQQVNCQGVMGKGVALQLKQKYPVIFDKYKDFCKENSSMLSKEMLGSCLPVKVTDSLIVVNLFAQDYYANNYGDETKRYTSYDALDMSLQKVQHWCKRNKLALDTIHHPMIGCGLAGAQWEVVRPMIDYWFEGCSTLWVLPEKKG